MYRNRCFVFCFVFCFVCEITRESEKCNLMEDCTIAISGGRNFVMVLIAVLFDKLPTPKVNRAYMWIFDI